MWVRVPALCPRTRLAASPSLHFLLCKGRDGTSDPWSHPAQMFHFMQ